MLHGLKPFAPLWGSVSGNGADRLQSVYKKKKSINEVVPYLFGALCLSYHYRLENSRISRKTARMVVHYVFLTLLWKLVFTHDSPAFLVEQPSLAVFGHLHSVFNNFPLE